MSDHGFDHAVRAVVGSVVGGPSRQDLATINDRIALVPQDEDDIFVWAFGISNNHVDSHATWMDRTSLENYARQANTGRGVPYLRNHDTSSDERGRVFRGQLVKGEMMTAADRSVPLARDVYRKRERELSLVETAFMRRGLVLGGTANDDLIANIESGISASNSIGFSVYTPASPGSYLECDMCGVDLFTQDGEGAYVCDHLPGVEYEARGHGGERVVATACVVNATQREASGVYLGSTPGTYTLANRAHELYTAGRVAQRDAHRLEDVLSLQRGMVTLGHVERLYSLPTDRAISNPTVEPKTGPVASDTTTKDDAMSDQYDAVARVREVLVDDPDRLAAIELADVSLATDPVGALHAALTDAVSRAEEERDEAVTASADFRRAMRERLTLDDGEDIAAGLDRLAADAAVAREYRGELTDELLRQMTRAGLEYDEPVQRALADRLTPAQVKAQTEMYRLAANKAITPGRVSEPELKPRNATAKVRRAGYAG